MTASPTVSLRDVSVQRPGMVVLRDVTLVAHEGESVAVFGPNGSGKSTLLRVLATLLPPASGTGMILGAPLGSGAEAEMIRPRIGLVGHEPALYPNLTLGENLELFASLTLGRGEAPDAAADALSTVGLAGAAHRPAGRSSNGMRRRAEFARLLVTEPALLLLDEAHVGLDPAAFTLVEHLVRRVTGRGGTAFVVAHERERVAPLVDRAIVIEDGHVREAA